MLVIDGQRGPLETGTLPMYEIPAVLLELLHITEPTFMDYTRAPQGMRIRPLAGLHINLFEDGAVELCREPPFSTACQASAHWLEQVRTVDDDLFIGEQFTRNSLQGVFPAVPENQEHPPVQQEL